MSEGFAPAQTDELVGHAAQAAMLAEAASGGRLHHAWLISGPEGVGKATLALRFLRWLLAGRPPGGPAPLYVPQTHPAFRRIAAGAHPDLRVLSPEAGERGVKRIIRVEDARAVPRFLSLTPAEGGWRGVLVDEAEAMNAEAQNALLKTLEEPPPRSVLVLTSHAPDRLLPTIRSRCRRLELFPLPEAEVAAMLERLLPEMPADERARLAALADGAPGRALRLAEGEGLAAAEEVERVLAAPLPAAERHALAERMAAKRDGSAFVLFAALLRRRIARAVAAAARGQGAEPWLAARPLAEWAGLWDTLGRIAAETEALNLDRKQAVLTSLDLLAPGTDRP
ncbi:MAG: DNA polymerase III subunit delta' [Acetobacteraceae bacterium]|nr:DNA polymerase III subunit delta' [Acetobacteraceae bacterium]